MDGKKNMVKQQWKVNWISKNAITYGEDVELWIAKLNFFIFIIWPEQLTIVTLFYKSAVFI